MYDVGLGDFVSPSWSPLVSGRTSELTHKVRECEKEEEEVCVCGGGSLCWTTMTWYLVLVIEKRGLRVPCYPSPSIRTRSPP